MKNSKGVKVLRFLVKELKRKVSLYHSAPDIFQQTRSQDQRDLPRQGGLKEAMVTISRHQSFQNAPSAIGKVFPFEDEAGETFNNKCLTDLKGGR